MTNPAFTQLTFRTRNDNGSETTATWRQTQGTDDSWETDTNYRIRFRIDETASRAWSNKTWNLYYSLNAGAYTAVGAGEAVNFASSANFAQGDNTTAQLTGGTGTFVTNNSGMCQSAGATNSGTAGYLFEVEYCVAIASTLVANNDTINLRVYDSSAAIAAYTDTPIITVVKFISGAAAHAASSTLTPVAGVIYNALTTLANTTTLLIAGTLYKEAVSAVSGSSVLTALGILYKNVLSSLASTSTLSVIGNTISGTVTGTLNKVIEDISKNLHGAVLITGRVVKKPPA